MKMRRGLWRSILLAAAVCLAFGVSGCEKDATALSGEGKQAFINQQYDQAIQSFEAALAKDAQNFDATLGLAEVYGKQKKFDKAREYYDKAKALKPSKANLQYLEQRFQEMLLAEAEGMEDKTSAAYEKSLRDIIEMDKRSGSANQAYQLLSDYYMERGQTLEKDKNTRQAAVDMFLQMKTIRTDRNLRTKALNRAKELQREIYKDQFADNFTKMKEQLVKDARYDEATKRVKITLLNEDKEINPKDDAEKEARAKDLQLGAFKELVKLSYDLAGVKVADGELKKLQLGSLKQDELIIEKGKETITLSAELADIEEVTYASVIVPMRSAAEQKDDTKKDDAKKDDAKKEEAPAAMEGDKKPEEGAQEKAEEKKPEGEQPEGDK